MLIYICDDDKVQLKELQENIKEYFMKKNIVADIKTYYSVDVMLSDMGVEKREIDIFVLDVEIDKYNGVEVAEKIRINNKSCDIIFISAYKEYVFDVFRTNPIDYLTKPIDISKLYNALDRIFIKKNNTKTIKIVHDRKEINIPVDRIMFIEGNGRKINIYLEDIVYSVYDKIDNVEKRIKELTPIYIRIHKSYLVNYKYIDRIKSEKVFLYNGRELNVSRKYKDDLKQFSISHFDSMLR